MNSGSLERRSSIASMWPAERAWDCDDECWYRIATAIEENVSRGAVRRFSPSRLRQARARAKLTLEDLALLSGVEKSTIGHWETGHTQPSAESLIRVAHSLRLEVADLVPVPVDDLRPVDFRNRLGLTQEQVSIRTGTAVGTIGSLERGGRRPSDRSLLLLATEYGVESDSLSTAWQRERNARLRRLAV